MKKLVAILWVFAASAACAFAVDFGEFKNASMRDKPWCYWWWVNGHVDKETITADLEAMKEVGFGGCLQFDARGYWEDSNHLLYPKPACEFMDAYWREHFKHAVSEADRLGLEFSANLSSCAGRLKGPWYEGKNSPKRLICKITPLESGKLNSLMLLNPDREFYWNISTYLVKYDGDAILKPTDWLNGGDGLYSMGVSGGRLESDKDVSKNRTALEFKDVTKKIDSNNVIDVDIPEGKWALVQFVCTTMDGHDNDVDVLDKSAVSAFYNRMAGALKSDLGGLFGKALTHFYSVSWEGAVPSWTLGLEERFDAEAGYSLEDWMPVLAGFTVKSKADSDKFMTDFRRVRNSMFKTNFYRAMIDLAHRDGLLWHSESGGPWWRKPQIFGEADQLDFLGINDMPQGEFWVNPYGKPGRYMNKPIANAAHIYGRNLVAIEAFTHMEMHWSMYPALLKPFVDQMFCDGANRVIWHTFTCSPEKFGKPGIEYFAGTHVNRNVTWHKQAAPFLEYIARCQYMLRQGMPVVDFCVYTGDVPYQHWGQWKDRAGEKSTVKIPRGYSYDILNNDVLINGAEFENGKLVLPGGMAYKALIVDLDSQLVSPEALEKILELKDAGLPVICGGTPPTGAAGLGEDSELVKELGRRLWENPITLESFIKNSKLVPDFGGDAFDAVHRSAGGAEIYFIAGDGKINAEFRASGVPEIWDAVSGERYSPSSWSASENGTSVVLDLPKNGSAFVVIKKAGDGVPKNWQPADSKNIEGKWKVEFADNLPEPKTVDLDRLVSWTELEDFDLKHYSGTATYSKSIFIPKVEGKIFLDLGEVSAVAEVFVNGKKCGTAWTYPMAVEITNALKDGENDIKIKVTNTWVNRLIGDAHLEPSKRVTKSNMALYKGKRTRTVYSGFASGDELQKSGLFGPVCLKTYKPSR